jgi:methyl-accepting chemotaxis protein
MAMIEGRMLMKNLTVSSRLGIGFATILGLLLVITVFGLWQLHRLADATQAMMNRPLKKERLVSDWYQVVSTSTQRTIAIAKSGDPALAQYFAQEQPAATKKSNDLQDQIAGLLDSPEERALFQQIGAQRTLYVQARDAIYELNKRGQTDAANQQFSGVFIPQANSFENSILALMNLQRAALNRNAGDIAASAATSTILMSSLAGIAILFGLVFAVQLVRSITRPLKDAVEVANQVARGDLTGMVSSSSHDELGQLLDSLGQMKGQLVSIVADVQQGTDAVAMASGQIAAGNADLSARTETQAAALQETAASMEQLSGTVKQNSESAKTASQLALNASETADKGSAVIDLVIDTMSGIEKSTTSIAAITAMIEGIAFQTNILALNAAVEAARAGEDGRGFAVVAGEVRSLAQRSAVAAKEIKELIETSVGRARSGATLVHQAGETMSEIIRSVRHVTGIMDEISAASVEQSHGIDQVAKAIAQMDEVTQQNAALVEQAAAAAGSLEDQASKLRATVSVFRID